MGRVARRLAPAASAPGAMQAARACAHGREGGKEGGREGGRAGGADPVGELDAADVGNVFAQSELAIDVLAVERHAAVEVDHALGARLEVGDVSVGPPLLQSPFRIELASLPRASSQSSAELLEGRGERRGGKGNLVVEAVGHLMAEDGANGAVVARGAVGGREEGLLQDACRNEDAVLVVAVEGVDHGWRRRPPSARRCFLSRPKAACGELLVASSKE